MFGSNRKDPLVDSVKKVMEKNEMHRQVERLVHEELGITSRRALPHERQAEYDSLMKRRLEEAAGTTLTEETELEEGKWNYPKEIKGKDPKVFWDLGNKIKKDARKAIRKSVKAKAHKELMSGSAKKETVSEGAIKRALIDREEKERLAKRKAAGLKNDDDLTDKEKYSKGREELVGKGTDRKTTRKLIGLDEVTRKVRGLSLKYMIAHKNDKDDTPPFDPDKKKSTPWTSPGSKAKHLARNAMKDMVKKTAKKVDEEAENLQELSKKTLKSYVKNAAVDSMEKSMEAGSHISQERYKLGNMASRKAHKRLMGIAKATDKLEEEEQLQELSKKTIKSYIKKAAADLKHNANNDGWWSQERRHATKASDWSAANRMQKKGEHRSERRVAGIQKAASKLEEESESHEKAEMKLLNKLDKKTDNLIKKDAEVHKKINEDSVIQEMIANLGEEQFKELISSVFEQASDASGLEVTPRGAPQGPYTRARGQRTIRMAQGNYDRLRQTQRNIAARPDTPETSTSSKPAETSSTRPGTPSSADHFRSNPNVAAREPNPRTTGISSPAVRAAATAAGRSGPAGAVASATRSVTQGAGSTAQAAPTPPTRPVPSSTGDGPAGDMGSRPSVSAGDGPAGDMGSRPAAPSAASSAAAAITRSAPRARPAAPSTASSASSSSSSSTPNLPQASRSGNTAQDDAVQRRNLKPQDVSTM